MHFLGLMFFTKASAPGLWDGLSIAISDHLSSPDRSGATKFPRTQFLRLAFALTLGITYPALLWFAAISLASYVSHQVVTQI